jgi:nucleoside-diphosphate-sugar epimerase
MSNADLHVIFGTGPVGMSVMEELLKKGKRIRLISQRGKGIVPHGVELRKGEAADPRQTIELCQGAAVVYNCANPPYTMWPEIFPEIQHGILEGTAAAGAKLVVMENLYMYGPCKGKPLTEDLLMLARDRKGETRARMALEISEAHKSGKVRTVSARASDFYGPRVLASAMGERIFYPALEGTAAQVLGNPDMLHTYTFIKDVGNALVILGERDEALGKAWHIPSALTVTTRQFIEMVYNEAGKEPRIKTVPKFMVSIIGMFNPTLRELSEILYQFEQPFIVDHSNYVQNFGDHSTPLQEAIRITLDWFRQNPVK